MLRPKLILPLAAVVISAAGFYLWPDSGKQPVAAAPKVVHQEAASQTAAPAETVELNGAIQKGAVQGDFRGNGRDAMQAALQNKTQQLVRVQIHAGQFFVHGQNRVVAIHNAEIDLKPLEKKTAELKTVAVHSSNRIQDAAYSLSADSVPRLSTLIAHLQAHPEISVATAQTAALALTENLPVSAFAKFTQPGADLTVKLNTSAFKVEVYDLISALKLLREIGVPDQQLALTIDPQLKIEAMIDPLAHATAMQYYGISSQQEWEFWKNELQNGDPSTRHYALYGIARFYPEVALKMLPGWARETRTSSVYRISAVQALAETQRPEAISVLRQLAHELGSQTDLGKAATTAADFLDHRLHKSQGSKLAVGFRASGKISSL
jgi:hypothetical protein